MQCTARWPGRRRSSSRPGAKRPVIGRDGAPRAAAWPHEELRLYVGCYRNDPDTIEAVLAAAEDDPRVRLVIHDRDGPSTKADCLNRLYRALEDDERRAGCAARMVVLHDAEDMVDPAALGLLDDMSARPTSSSCRSCPHPLAPVALDRLALLRGIRRGARQGDGRARRAGRGLADRRGRMRDRARQALIALDHRRGADGPFAAECLTEDYELGLGRDRALGGRSRFLRCARADGRLVATRACFPARLDWAVRQKTRWIHGIAFQSWDRLGWSRRPADLWMRLRDRRGPLTALVLAVAYLLAGVGRARLGWRVWPGSSPHRDASPLLIALLAVNLVSFAWRAAWRFAFTAREYGWAEGRPAVLRIPVANVIAIMAGRRALFAYVRFARWPCGRSGTRPATPSTRRSPAPAYDPNDARTSVTAARRAAGRACASARRLDRRPGRAVGIALCARSFASAVAGVAARRHARSCASTARRSSSASSGSSLRAGEQLARDAISRGTRGHDRKGVATVRDAALV